MIHMAHGTALKPSAPRRLPPPNSDFYQFAQTLSAGEQAILKKARAFMETKVAPIVAKLLRESCWAATGPSSTTALPAFSRTPRRSIRMKAVSDVTPDRHQGGHWLQRLRVSKGEPPRKPAEETTSWLRPLSR